VVFHKGAANVKIGSVQNNHVTEHWDCVDTALNREVVVVLVDHTVAEMENYHDTVACLGNHLEFGESHPCAEGVIVEVEVLCCNIVEEVVDRTMDRIVILLDVACPSEGWEVASDVEGGYVPANCLLILVVVDMSHVEMGSSNTAENSVPLDAGAPGLDTVENLPLVYAFELDVHDQRADSRFDSNSDANPDCSEGFVAPADGTAPEEPCSSFHNSESAENVAVVEVLIHGACAVLKNCNGFGCTSDYKHPDVHVQNLPLVKASSQCSVVDDMHHADSLYSIGHLVLGALAADLAIPHSAVPPVSNVASSAEECRLLINSDEMIRFESYSDNSELDSICCVCFQIVYGKNEWVSGWMVEHFGLVGKVEKNLHRVWNFPCETWW